MAATPTTVLMTFRVPDTARTLSDDGGAVQHAYRQICATSPIVQDGGMSETPNTGQTGRITIEWTVGWNPEDLDTYKWSVRCDPPIPDELVSGLLAEVIKVY
jgi:hypothetical protein